LDIAREACQTVHFAVEIGPAIAVQDTSPFEGRFAATSG
jgi:hypothetical protein